MWGTGWWQWVQEWAGAQLPAPHALGIGDRGLVQAVVWVLDKSLPGTRYISMAASSPAVA